MDQKENITCTMDDVQGDVLGPPHGTTPAAVRANKNSVVCFGCDLAFQSTAAVMSGHCLNFMGLPPNIRML